MPEATHHWYDPIYRAVFDPTQRELRDAVAAYVPQGSSALSVGCGTGDELFRIAGKLRRGVGVELSRTLLRGADAERSERGFSHLSFQFADATHLPQFTEGEFDVAIASLMLHEVPADRRVPIVCEMARVALRVILADRAHPHRSLWDGLQTEVLEMIAGRSHYRNYRTYMRGGGLRGIAKAASLSVIGSTLCTNSRNEVLLCGREREERM